MAYISDARKWSRGEIEQNGSYIVAFLTASYMYYHHGDMDSICDDKLFDWVCREMIAKWDTLEHPHKHLIKLEDLDCGSGFAIPEDDYPRIVKNVALSMSTGHFTLECKGGYKCYGE